MEIASALIDTNDLVTRKQRPRKMNALPPILREAQEGSDPSLHHAQHVLHHPTLPFPASQPAQLRKHSYREVWIKRPSWRQNLGEMVMEKQPSSAVDVLPHAARQGGRWGCCFQIPLGELQDPGWPAISMGMAKRHPAALCISYRSSVNTCHEKSMLMFLPSNV